MMLLKKSLSMSKNKVCFASIDVEHDIGTDGDKKFNGVGNINALLDLFRKFRVPATLFVTGDVLAKYPREINEWSKGYEIASHSYSHVFFNKLGKWEKADDIEKSVDIYRSVLGGKPKGFRAPSHIVDNETMRILCGKGFLYDSSIVPHYPPLKNYDGYIGCAPRKPYMPSEMNCLKKGDMGIVEIPVSGQILGLPLAGSWIKKLPIELYKFLFLFHKPDFITVSLHSWDSLGSAGFVKDMEDILYTIANSGYVFKTGEQIADEFYRS